LGNGGPRQVGKTTTCRALGAFYHDWDNLDDRKLLLQGPKLRYLRDKEKREADFVVVKEGKGERRGNGRSVTPCWRAGKKEKRGL